MNFHRKYQVSPTDSSYSVFRIETVLNRLLFDLSSNLLSNLSYKKKLTEPNSAELSWSRLRFEVFFFLQLVSNNAHLLHERINDIGQTQVTHDQKQRNDYLRDVNFFGSVENHNFITNSSAMGRKPFCLQMTTKLFNHI